MDKNKPTSNPMMDITVQYGTFLPALIKVMQITDGPVLELGMGMFSTPYLHFACYPNRRLVSYESDEEYFNWLNIFKNDYHEVHLVKDWDKIDLSGHWSVVLVDHEPARRRKEEIKRLANCADYIVVHDTNPRLEHKYRYSEIYPLFKFRKDFNREKPYTAILSNFRDLSQITDSHDLNQKQPSLLPPNTIANPYYSIPDLDKDSLVIDAGGYFGDFTANLGCNCKVIIFEPEPNFYEHIKKRFKDDPKIRVEPFALGKKEGESELYIRKDATSLYKELAKSTNMVKVPVIRLSSYIKDFSQVDLLKLNIEGSEYDVIQDLAENEQISKITEILVQFHIVASGTRHKYRMSRETLSKSHRKTGGNFKWETWKKI